MIARSTICKEINQRIMAARKEMQAKGYAALIVYGNNKVYGSLRYLTDYFPDRAGWTSLSATETFLFDGAALFLPLEGEPALLLEPGLLAARDVCTDKILAAGFSPDKDSALTADCLARLIAETGVRGTVGIETWDRFPAPLFMALTDKLPEIDFIKSTIVEELRLAKSPFEVEIIKRAAMIGDMAHEAVVNAMANGTAKTELEIIRIAEHTMRSLDPIYEDSCSNTPSLICSGFPVAGALLHLPCQSKQIRRGDVIHWDIGSRYYGYSIDTSRTRVIGKPTPRQLHAHKTTLLMMQEVLKEAKPGVKAASLVELADNVAREEGFKLWDAFLGHGLGIEVHERPDLVKEETRLAENMILAIEPRVSLDDIYLVGLEDMVLITENGGIPLTQFDSETLEL